MGIRIGENAGKPNEAVYLVRDGERVVGFIRKFKDTPTSKSPYQIFAAGNAETGKSAVLLCNVHPPKLFRESFKGKSGYGQDIPGTLNTAKSWAKDFFGKS